MLQRSTLQLLRFHFSFFLLPVYLFALSQATQVNWNRALLVFGILHLLVYPSSNGYNSYMDRDETPIGGLEKPLPPTKQLFWVTILLDLLAIGLSLFISLSFTLGIVLYILASRAYSYRGIRLKKYPVIGFLTVFIFQGALVYYCSFSGIQQEERVSWMACIIASFLIGALYPLTQVYQHEADKKDGVTTISFLLGKRGTFFFSMALFLGAAMCLFLLFQEQLASNYFLLFLLITMPVVLFFMYWLWRVWNDENEADFKNSYRMNVIATLCTTAYFSTLIILNHFE